MSCSVAINGPRAKQFCDLLCWQSQVTAGVFLLSLAKAENHHTSRGNHRDEQQTSYSL